MATSSAVLPWTLTMPAGSQEQFTFVFSTINASTGQSIPYPISGATWEYVCRNSSTDITPGGVFNITTTGNAAGSISVISSATLSQVTLTINPVATAAISPQTYWHALWMNPGSATAYTWLTGNLVVVGNPQP